MALLRLPYTRRLSLLAEDLTRCRNEVGSIASRLAFSLADLGKPPPAFVCALVEGHSEDGKLRTCGMAGVARARSPNILLETTCMRPLTGLRVTVFADLERVSVHGIFCGVDLATVALGECPVAYFDEWVPGVKLRVQCILREKE